MFGRRASRLAPPRHCPWRLATAVRGLASRNIRVPLRAALTHAHGAMRRDGDIAPYRHYTRNNRTRITHDHGARALPGRRDGDIAPYRHYTRNIRAAITHAITHGHCAWRLATPRRDSRPARHPRECGMRVDLG